MTPLPTPSAHALLAFHQRATEESRWPVDEVATGTAVDLALIYLRLMLDAATRPNCSGISLAMGYSAKTQHITMDCMYEIVPGNSRVCPVFRPPVGLETDRNTLRMLHHDAVVLLLDALKVPPAPDMGLPPSMAASTHHILLRPAHRPTIVARVSWHIGEPLPSIPTYVRT